AHTGLEAVQTLGHDADFDVVVCDLMMPDLDGRGVFEFIKRHAPHLEPYLIFCSGGAFTSRMRDFAATLANPCLEKPVDGATLLAAVEQALAKRER
ncbi:MAG: response regulator, partial [Myxococcota bacterium]